MAIYSGGKVLGILIWAIGLLTLIAQFALIIQHRVVGVAETILRFFCYFTILTNILVMMVCFFQWNSSTSRMASFFRKATTKSAVAVYILVVFLVYNIALRGLVNFTGIQILVDELLHVIIPVLYLFYWIFFSDKKGVQWNNALRWLIYPALYLLFVLSVGALLPSRFYPYPFLDVYNHGYQKVLYAVLVVLVLFLVLSVMFIGFSRVVEKKAMLSAKD